MRIVVPMDVNDSNLTTNVVNEEADWSAGTYNLGDRAVEGEYVYEVVADPNTTDNPVVGAAKETPTWILLGYKNQLRMFREGVDSISDAIGDIEVSVPVPTAISTVGVLNAVGLEVNVRLVDSSIMNIEAPTIENVAGTKDGVNTAFTISTAGAEVLLFLNGLKLTEGVDYNLAGTAITAAGTIPEDGDTFIAVIFDVDAPTVEDVAGTKNGVNLAFTISEAGGEAVLFFNGVKLIEDADYTRSGVNITMLELAPVADDIFEAVIFVDAVPTIESLDGDKNGVNVTFLMSVAGEASLFLNGIRQVEGVDYTRDGFTITATGSIPNVGDDYIAIIYPDILFPGGVIYDTTKLITDIGVANWWEYFFTTYERSTTLVFDDLPAYFGAGVTLYVTIVATGPTDPTSVGRVIIGPAIDAGRSLAGVRSRNFTFTQKTRDEFGNLTLVTRRTIRVVDFPVMIPSGSVYYVQQKAASLSGTPTLFIADPNKPETVVFGVFEDFSVLINGVTVTEGSISIEEY